MMRIVLTLILIVNCAFLQAQFTYFNQITGVLDDENSESVHNVELANDGYMVWGGGVDSIGQLYHFVRKYNLLGDILDENVLIHQNQQVLSGVINSFKWNPFTETFVYIHGTNLPNSITEGYLIEFDQNLDTTFTRRYDHYAPYTYPFVFEVESDGYIVLGELGNDAANGAGTFIMKLSFAGDIIWTEILQPNVPSFIYRNIRVLPIPNGYLVSGGVSEGYYPNQVHSGLITVTDTMGNTMSELEVLYDDALETGRADVVRTTNGEIWLCRPIGYAEVDEIDNPFVFWTKIRMEKFNLETEEIYDIQDYHTNFEFVRGSHKKMVATPDGGVVIVGGRYGFNFDAYSWIMKLDADRNEEWFQEYTYQSCETCFNVLYDIEIAPDGGYIAAGSFTDYDYDIRNTTWLLKIDACGDLEWQGCSPVGVEIKVPNAFKVYPNPSVGQFTVESEFNQSVSSWAVYNLAGQKVAEGHTKQSENLEINLNLPSGLYALELVLENGSRENHKIQILKC